MIQTRNHYELLPVLFRHFNLTSHFNKTRIIYFVIIKGGLVNLNCHLPIYVTWNFGCRSRWYSEAYIIWKTRLCSLICWGEKERNLKLFGTTRTSDLDTEASACQSSAPPAHYLIKRDFGGDFWRCGGLTFLQLVTIIFKFNLSRMRLLRVPRASTPLARNFLSTVKSK